jgi:hypothetical protein
LAAVLFACALLLVFSVSIVDTMSTPAKVLVSMRLEPDVAERLEALAEQDRRTTSNFLRNVVTDWLAGRKVTHTRTEKR